MRKYFQDNVPNIHKLLKYVGPGFIVTVGFIDPGNWATNMQAGSEYGYTLLWVITLSTLILILLQYNASKLGIITKKSIPIAVNKSFNKFVAIFINYTGFLAVIATLIAELLGGAIALQMLFKLPISIGAVLMALVTLFFVFTNTYSRVEAIIISFVSIIGISFLLELIIVGINPSEIIKSSVVVSIPDGSMLIIMGVLGAVIMPHNLFLHSEFIQTRTFEHHEDVQIVKKQLNLAKTDTLISMTVGLLINGAMIVLAAATFYQVGIVVTDLSQAQEMLKPFLGNFATIIFALALLFSGIASSITAAMSGGVVSSGMNNERYNIYDRHTSIGIISSVLISTLIIWFIKDPFSGLIISQVILSIQLPITIVALIILTSKNSLMGLFTNTKKEKFWLWLVAIIVIILNILLFIQIILESTNKS